MRIHKKFRSYVCVVLLLVVALFMVSCLCFGITGADLFRWFGLSRERCRADEGAFTFYRVGNGDASVVYTAQAIGLVDTGTQYYARSLQNELESLTDDHLDFVIISHPHDDHAGGYFNLLENFTVDRLFIRQYSSDQLEDWEYYQSILDISEQKGVEIIHPKDRDLVWLGDISVSFYAPDFYTREENDRCLLSHITVANQSCLYMGDSGLLTEDYLISNGYFLSADLLKIGHHGSKLATSAELLSAVSPDYAVICVGTNQYGHPDEGVIEKLRTHKIPFYRTDSLEKVAFLSQDGEIVVKVN